MHTKNDHPRNRRSLDAEAIRCSQIEHEWFTDRLLCWDNPYDPPVYKDGNPYLCGICFVPDPFGSPLPEHRKYCIWRILAPYFINVKHLSFDDSYNKIYQWLERCNELKESDFDP